MKKTAEKTRQIGRTGAERNPVIAVRVPPALHHRITKAAQDGNRSMSEVMADLLARAFDWHDAFGDRVSMLKQAKAELEQMIGTNFEVEAIRRGWRRPLPPELRTGFKPDDPAPNDIKAHLATITALETRLNKLRASQDQDESEADAELGTINAVLTALEAWFASQQRKKGA